MIDWTYGPDTRQGGKETTIRVNAMARDAFLRTIETHFENRSGFSVATLNLDHVVKIRDLPAFRAAYARHTHVTADGNPIVWLSRLSGTPVELIPGSELIEPLCDLAARHGVSVALMGSTEASLAAAADALRRRVPDLHIVAQIAPPMGFDPEGETADSCIDRLATSGAGLCFLALGAPKQEIFAARAQDRLPHTGFLSIGAGLDFISGQQKRAPRLVRGFAGEWLWRLSTNPTRFYRRYAACIGILPRLLVTALRARARGV